MFPIVLGASSWQPFPWWVYLFAGFILGILVGIGMTRLNARALWRAYLAAKRESGPEAQPGQKGEGR